jgi:hypothetical protein
MAAPDPRYDVNATLPAGVLLTREIEAGLHAAYVAGGYVALTAEQVLAVTGAAPAVLTTIPRLPA